MSVPVRSGDGRDEIDRLHVRLSELESTCAERDAEITRARIDLAEFRIRYRREVGHLHEELEDLERAIAEAELGEFAKRLKSDDAGDPAPAATGPIESTPRLTSDAIRKLFREVARTIHPDLAFDDHTRDRRHALMVEANRAYAIGDEERLRLILDAWEKSPESVQGEDPASERLRLERRIAQRDAQLVACVRTLSDLQETPLWRLKIMVDEAAARGKNLVADHVRRLKRDITAARNRLDAMTL